MGACRTIHYRQFAALLVLMAMRAGVAFSAHAQSVQAQSVQAQSVQQPQSAQSEDYKQNPRVQGEIAKAAQYQADHKTAFAIDAYEKANKLAGGRCVSCLVQLADMYRETGDEMRSAKAAARLELIVTSPQDKATADTLEGTALLREATARKKRELFQQADQKFQAALRYRPDLTQVLFLDGVAQGRIGNDAAARQSFQKYVASKDSDPVMQARARRYLADPALVRETMAPAFSIRTKQGEVLSLDNQQGRVVLLDFWATSSEACKAELPHMQKIAQRYRGAPLVVLSVSIDDDPAKWRAFVDQHGMAWPQYWDGDGQLAAVFGVHKVPTYFTIDAQGVLHSEASGNNAGIDGQLKKLVAQAKRMRQQPGTVSAGGQ